MTRTHSMRKLPFWRRQFLSITFYFLFPSILLADAASTNEETSLPLLEFAPLDYLLIILSSALVFLMQAGFKCFEVGMLRQKHSVTIGMKNIIDYIVVAIGYFLVGFALMFGSSQGGMFGTSFFALEDINSSGSGFFLFQLAFAATSVTIVSGAMAERTGFMTYLIASVCVGTLIYPVVGHWVWGGIYITEGNTGWLQKLGFYDFAGATVVHGTGAWVALIGVWMLGPRLGRYDTVTGKFNTFEGYNLPYAILGVIILWLGWWGFNGGSTLAVEKDGKMLLGDVILNTSLAAAGGGLAGFFHSFFFQAKADINEKLLGSILGGLVAITASASIMSPVLAILIGLVAGVLHNYSYDLILK